MSIPGYTPSPAVEALIKRDIISGRKVRELWYEPLYHRIKYQKFTRIYKDIKSKIIYRTVITNTTTNKKSANGYIEARIWKYQRGTQIEDSEAWSKWNEANGIIANRGLTDSMVEAIDSNTIVEDNEASDIGIWKGYVDFVPGGKYIINFDRRRLEQ